MDAPGWAGITTMCDSTVVDTVAASYITQKTATAKGSAEIAAARKHTKYSELEMRYTFVPVAVETFGTLNGEDFAFLSETGSRRSSTTGDTLARTSDKIIRN